jgi:multiple sugar transport system substrate-binding protein
MEPRTGMMSRLTRRRLLGGLAGAAATALLAACGGSATNTPVPAASTAPSAAAAAPSASSAAPSTSPASGGGATATAGTGAASARPSAPGGATPAASGSTAPATPATSAAGVATTPTPLPGTLSLTLEFWFGEPPENGPADMAAAFTKIYPNIKVNPTRYVNDDPGNTKLDTALQGGTPIDVYMSYGIPRLGQRIKAGAAVDLTPFIGADAAVKAWTESTQGLYKSDGKLFSLPTVRDPFGVIVNKTMLDKASVKVPEKWTIDEFRAMAKQLSKGDVYGTYTPPDTARIALGSNYWYKADGKSSNFDNPAFLQWMQLWRGMIDEKSSFPWTEVLAQNLRTYQQNVFLGSQAAFWPASAFNLRYVNDLQNYPHDFVTTFAPMPVPAGVTKPFNPGSISNDVVMNSKTKNKEAAWAFLRYRLIEGAQFMLKSGKAPSFPGTSPDAVVEGILGPNRDKLYDVAAFRKIYVDPVYDLVNDTISTGGAAIQQIVNQQTDRCLIGEITPEQWVAMVKQQADEAIQKAG